MPIYFSQHGRSASKDVDPERGLTPEGRAEVADVADVLSRSGVRVDAVMHSGKARAAQTAELLAAAVHPRGATEAVEGIAPLDDVAAFAVSIPVDRHVLYVGHLPFMERIVSHLVAGDAELPVLRFRNGCVVRLDRDAGSGRWVIAWTVYPNIGGE